MRRRLRRSSSAGSYAPQLYEDYIERGPGSFLGDFTGMPMSDEGRAKALRYSSSLPSMIERQCLAQSPWVGLYRPLALRIWSEVDESGRVVAWVMGGDYLRDTVRIWMDGRPHPSANAWHSPSGFTTGHWEGDTLVARTTHVKTAWIRRGVGIPGSDQSTFTVFITRRENLLTIMTIQEDPIYLTEPHVVSRVWEFDPRASQGPLRDTCNVGVEIPSLEDTGEVAHYLPGQNPEEDYMVRTYNIPKEAAMGYAHTLYPEYRKTLRSIYKPPASCGRYCCGWIERQGLPGAAPGLTCNDGNLPAELRKAITAPSGSPRVTEVPDPYATIADADRVAAGALRTFWSSERATRNSEQCCAPICRKSNCRVVREHLEVGCGTGAVSRALVESLNFEVTGVDPSPIFVARAKNSESIYAALPSC